MQGIDLLQRARDKRARDQRIGTVRAAVDALAPDEREELLIELLSEMEQGAAPQESGPATPSVRIAPVQSASNQQTEFPHVTHGRVRIGDAVLEVMRDGVARATGEIIEAVVTRFPSVNSASVPAAVARMVTEADPPQLIKRGKNGRGHAIYVIAPDFLKERG